MASKGNDEGSGEASTNSNESTAVVNVRIYSVLKSTGGHNTVGIDDCASTTQLAVPLRSACLTQYYLGDLLSALPAGNQAAPVLWNDALAEVVAEGPKTALKRRMLSDVSLEMRRR